MRACEAEMRACSWITMTPTSCWPAVMIVEEDIHFVSYDTDIQAYRQQEAEAHMDAGHEAVAARAWPTPKASPSTTLSAIQHCRHDEC
jgi:hypothetical protein